MLPMPDGLAPWCPTSSDRLRRGTPLRQEREDPDLSEVEGTGHPTVFDASEIKSLGHPLFVTKSEQAYSWMTL